MPSPPFSPIAVWSQVPVASRTIEVNTKTGFSLTAGSYSVRASSTQTALIVLNGVGTNTATVSAVTTTRATVTFNGCITYSTVLGQSFTKLTLTNTTTVTADKSDATAQSQITFTLTELF